MKILLKCKNLKTGAEWFQEGEGEMIREGDEDVLKFDYENIMNIKDDVQVLEVSLNK
jgi:hypothetical protein